MIPRLHTHDNQFTSRNLSLYALLGIVSVGRRALRQLERAAPADSTAAPGQSSAGVFAVLGAIALYRRVEGELASWAPRAAEPLDEGLAPSAQPSDGLPRRLLR